MKISSINSTQYKPMRNPNVQTLTQNNMSHSMNFKSSDYFDFSWIRFDQSILPKNIKLTKNERYNPKKIEGRFLNNAFYMNYGNGRYSGICNSQPFEFSVKNGIFNENTEKYSGVVNSRNFVLTRKLKGLDDLYLTGDLGGDRIEMIGVKSPYDSRYKGYYGNDSIELAIDNNPIGKKVIGRVNDEKFAFIFGKDDVIGGSESKSELFPIIMAIVERTFNVREGRKPGYDEEY